MSSTNLTMDQAQLAIEKHFKFCWNARTPVKWDNRPNPEGLEQEDYWVAFSVEMGDSHTKCTSDANEYRQTGRVICDLNFKKNSGPQLFPKVVGYLNSIFRGKNLSGVRMGAPMVSPELGDDSYYRKVVSYPFNFDDK